MRRGMSEGVRWEAWRWLKLRGGGEHEDGAGGWRLEM